MKSLFQDLINSGRKPSVAVGFKRKLDKEFPIEISAESFTSRIKTR